MPMHIGSDRLKVLKEMFGNSTVDSHFFKISKKNTIMHFNFSNALPNQSPEMHFPLSLNSFFLTLKNNTERGILYITVQHYWSL